MKCFLLTARKALARWLKFNAVGAGGILVQVGMLTLLAEGLRLSYLAATALAVEAALLHNFWWHQRWTWRDRREAAFVGVLARLVKFHAANGVISLAGNLALMELFAKRMRIHYLAANLLAITLCSLANFALAHRYVFRSVKA